MVDLIISIVNHSHRLLLEPLLASIVAHTKAISYEIFVVDNASVDDSVQMVRERYPQVRLLCNPAPDGFAGNNNQVLRADQGRYYVLLNDDMLLVNDALDRMVRFMDAHAGTGVVACKLLNADGSLQRSCWRGFPSPRGLLVDMFYLSKLLPRTTWVQESESTLHDTQSAIEVDHVLGACLMVRREVVNQVGMLDESFYMFLEETDWCYRIKKAAWKIYWVPDGTFIHYGQQSVSRDPPRFIPMLYRNYCRFCRKHEYSTARLIALKAVIVCGALFRTGLWLYRYGKGHPGGRTMVRGYWRAIREVPTF